MEVHKLVVKGDLLVELNPKRGYSIEENSLLIDHHEGLCGLYMVRRDGSIKPIIEVKEEEYCRSAAHLTLKLLELKTNKKLEKLIKIIDIIDMGRSRENEEALTYLSLIHI